MNNSEKGDNLSEAVQKEHLLFLTMRKSRYV